MTEKAGTGPTERIEEPQETYEEALKRLDKELEELESRIQRIIKEDNPSPRIENVLWTLFDYIKKARP